MDSSSGICCITQSFLDRAKTAFEDTSEKYENFLGSKPNFTSPTTLVYKPRLPIKRVKKDDSNQETNFRPISSIPYKASFSADPLELNTQKLNLTNPKPNPRKSNLYSYIAFHQNSNKKK